MFYFSPSMKKPQFLLFALALFCFASSFAQSTVTGSIVDAETKLPLEGASVFAQNTTKGTVTDKEGRFRLYLNKGGYELIVFPICLLFFTALLSRIKTIAPVGIQIGFKMMDKGIELVSHRVAQGIIL